MSSTSPQLHGYYSPSFPAHPAWNMFRPILDASCMRESLSIPFDFYFVAGDSRSSQSTALDVLLLTPGCLKSTREATIGKLEKLLQSSGSSPIFTAIVFLLVGDSSLHQCDGAWWMNELMELEALMIQYAPKACPILPISDTSKFLDFIQSYMERKFTNLGNLPALCADEPLKILTRMTKNGTKANEAYPDDILTCLYSSLRDVSQARNFDQITVLLQMYLGVEYDGQNIADFLREDSKVD